MRLDPVDRDRARDGPTIGGSAEHGGWAASKPSGSLSSDCKAADGFFVVGLFPSADLREDWLNGMQGGGRRLRRVFVLGLSCKPRVHPVSLRRLVMET